MHTLKEQLKTKKFSDLYLFYGTESFMLETYKKRLVDALLDVGEREMNYDVFSDLKTSMDAIADAIETLPFLSERRLVIIERLGLFKKTKDSDAQKLLKILEQKPSETIVIVIEEEVDKRIKLYKHFDKAGHAVGFTPLSEEELIKFIARSLSQVNKKIEVSTARFMINHVGSDLSTVSQELQKLIDYAGDDEIVTHEQIDAICQRSVESKIFELVDCMGTNRRSRALKLYHDLIASKEPANRILYMLTRQFRMNYKAKLYHAQGVGDSVIAQKLKVQPFIAKKALSQGRGFKLGELEQALNDCLSTELDIKTGQMDPVMAVELLVMRYSG